LSTKKNIRKLPAVRISKNDNDYVNSGCETPAKLSIIEGKPTKENKYLLIINYIFTNS